jgi:alkanesulfonate monooxygenase SsuD/methylene tetrahydromethanopterin reductase-like flavin-dependent oxidoreductase (luciferase family)
VELFANLNDATPDPAAWARDREAEGWDGVACADHYFSVGRSVRAFPHVWTSLGAMAAATSRVRLQPAFGNNLLRSPVEFAQAVLMVHAQSGGRAEAGLGAGWSRAELEAAGLPFPDGRDRARMLREAILVVRDLLRTGVCRFEGEHYRIDVPVLGPLSDPPPPVVASLGSPWTLRNIAPLVDRVEVSAGRSNRTGVNDLAALSSVTVDEVRAMVATVRDVAPGVPLTFMAFAAAGTDAGVEKMRVLGDALYASLVGEPAAVANRLRSIAETLGVDRVQVTGWTPGTYAELAPELFV